jgi:uncharacterized protein YjbJ (UPF0337 family)
MNILQAKGNWNIVKGKLKQRFARLAEDELHFREGKEDELIGRIQKRSGEAKEKVAGIIAECCGCNHESRI